MNAGYLKISSFILSARDMALTKIYLDNVRRGEREGGRERKREKTNLFKSGRKNPLGISDLLHVQLDVSNERPTGARWRSGKNYALIDSRPCRLLRDALRCPYTWTTRLPFDIDIPSSAVRYGFVN